jgi:hypothetical protein
MRYDDFFEGETDPCDDDGSSGSLYALGTSQIYALFETRAARFPEMADSTFFALVEAVLKPFDEFLSPEEFEELRRMVSMTQHELGDEHDPVAKHEACKERVDPYRGRPRRAEPRPPGRTRPRKRRPK